MRRLLNAGRTPDDGVRHAATQPYHSSRQTTLGAEPWSPETTLGADPWKLYFDPTQSAGLDDLFIAVTWKGAD